MRQSREHCHIKTQTPCFDDCNILRYTIKVKQVVMSNKSYRFDQ